MSVPSYSIERRHMRVVANEEKWSGLDKERKESDASAMEYDKRITDIERLLPTLATKEDLAGSRHEVALGFADLKSEFQKMRADVANTQVKVEQSIQSWGRWNIGIVITMFGTIGISALGLLYTIWNTNKTAVPPAPTPVVATAPQRAGLPSAPSAK